MSSLAVLNLSVKAQTDLLMKFDLRVIGKYPENTVMAFDSCNDERSGPLFVCGIDLCSAINEKLCSLILITEVENHK